MAYTPTNWQARTGTGLNRFVDQHGNTLDPDVIADRSDHSRHAVHRR